MRLLMIFNPHAGYGRAAKLLPRIRGELEKIAEVDVLKTGGAGDAIRLVADAELSAYQGVLAAGGDGTLFEVLNGLYSHGKESRVPLGLVPVGTGNAFARDLDLMPGDWEKAVRIIAQSRIRAVDVGRVTTHSESFHFLNIIGAGLPVDAMEMARKLKFMGNTAYTLATLWRAMSLKSYPLVIEIDGNIIDRESMFVEISNTRYTGTSFMIAPAAVLDDGFLDLTLVGRLSRRRLLRLFPSVYQGNHVRYPEVFTCKAKKIKLISPSGMALAPDGEIHGRTPAQINCLHRDLQIFV